MSKRCSNLKHRHFRGTVYSITEKIISGVHVSQVMQKRCYNRWDNKPPFDSVLSLSSICAKNYQNQLMWVEVIVCYISVVF